MGRIGTANLEPGGGLGGLMTPGTGGTGLNGPPACLHNVSNMHLLEGKSRVTDGWFDDEDSCLPFTECTDWEEGVVGGTGGWGGEEGEMCGGENETETSSNSRRPLGISRSSKGCLRFIKGDVVETARGFKEHVRENGRRRRREAVLARTPWAIVYRVMPGLMCHE